MMVQKVGVSRKQTQKLYQTNDSIIDHLPWVEALENDKAILLEDNQSVGAVYEISPKGTEGRTQDFLTGVRDNIEDAIQDVFPELDESPWVLQTYTFNEPELSGFMCDVERYVRPEAQSTEYTEKYLKMMRKHYRGVCKPGGLFFDENVTRTQWGGCRQRNYLVIYRRGGGLSELNETGERLFSALRPCGIASRRLSGSEFHRWMTRWFNQYSSVDPDSTIGLANMVDYGDDTVPFGSEFSESLFYSYPESSRDGQYWKFDRTYSRCLSVEGIRKRPDVGQATGETRRGEAISTMMDQLPEGTVMVSTIVIVPGDTVESHIDQIAKAAIGDASESSRTKADCDQAKGIMSERHKLYRCRYAFYVNANSEGELNRRSHATRAVLLNQGFQATSFENDVRSLDNYLINLPMKYDAELDRLAKWPHAQLMWVQHMASLSCFFGRSIGTGHPGVIQSNRGGEPLTFDPLNKLDREKNAHMLFVGPPGAGKSVTLAGMISNALAMSRPRVFIIEAGNSFGLLADYYRELGLTVNVVSLKPGFAPALPTFKDAHLCIDADLDDDKFGIDPDDYDEMDDETVERDVLGEMEIIATLMITGGEEKEVALIRRADRRVIRDAIILAAGNTQGNETLTEHVRDAFYEIAKDDRRSEQSQERAQDMGDAIGMFCDGFSGDVFNKPGEIWPEADVTLVDLANFSREGYEAHLSIAVIGVLSVINNIAERDQHKGREIITAIDEAHVITTNEMLCPYLVKIAKMWRKLGAWLWLATQNIDDFPGSAKKLLNIIEWWICLVMPKQEVEEINRFRQLSPEQKAMLLSASKADRQYTEGVVLSSKLEVLFRSVPPSLMLALAMTEKHEKSQRRQLMDEHSITEVQAAYRVADEIDTARGIAA